MSESPRLERGSDAKSVSLSVKARFSKESSVLALNVQEGASRTDKRTHLFSVFCPPSSVSDIVKRKHIRSDQQVDDGIQIAR
jgi:hypothetical protein